MLAAFPGVVHAQIVTTSNYYFDPIAAEVITDTISGPGSITMGGSSTLVLAADNTYAGTTTIDAGTLQIGNGGTTGTLGAGNVANNSVLAFRRSDTLTLNNQISGSGSVRVGSGTVILTGINTYGGGTTITGGGTLQIADGAAIGAGALTLDGGHLRVTGSTTISAVFNTRGTRSNRVSAAAGQTVTLDGAAYLSGAQLHFGSATDTGTIIWSANGGGYADYQLFVDGGTLRDGNTNVALMASTISRTEIAAGATLDFAGSDATINNLQGAGTLQNGSAATTINNGNFAGTITGAQSVTVAGALTLSGASTYTGATTVQSGVVLAVTNATALGTTAGGTTVMSGGALHLDGAFNLNESLTLGGTGIANGGALRNISGTRDVSSTITLTSDTRINSDAGDMAMQGLTGNGHALTIGGDGTMGFFQSLSNISSLTKDGAGTAYLYGLNSIAGSTTIDGGRLVLVSGNALSDVQNVNVASGTLELAFISETIGSLSGAGRVNLNSGGLVTGGDNTSTTFAGTIDGSSAQALTKVGAGTFTLTGSNSYIGTTLIQGGTLQIGNGGPTGTLGLGDVVNNSVLAFDRRDTLTVDNNVTGTGNLIKNGTGTLILAGANAYNGTTTINAGMLQIGNGGTTGTLGIGNITNHGSLVFNRSNTLTVNNQISGGGSVTMVGSGTLVLTGANTYSGNTVLQAGTLQLDNLGVLGTGDILLEGGALRTTVSGTLFKRMAWNSSNSVVSAAAGTILELTGITELGVGSNALRFGTATDTGRIVLSGVGLIYSPEINHLLSVEGATLQAAAGSDLLHFITSSVGSTQIAAGATLDFNGFAGTIRNLQGAGTLTNGVSTTVQAGNFSGAITGAGGLIKAGSGTLALSGTGSFSGGTAVAGGTLQLDNLDAVVGTITFQGGTLRTTVSGTLENYLRWDTADSTISAAAGTVLNATGGIRIEGGANVLRFGSATDTGTIVLTGGGIFQLPINDDAVVIAGGTLQAAPGFNMLGALTGTLGTARVDSGATLDFNGNSGFPGTVLNLLGEGTVTNTGTTTISGGNFAGSLSGTGGLLKDTGATLVLTGDNTLGGTTTIGGGTLQIGNGGLTGNLGGGAIVNFGSLVFNRAGTLEMANIISGYGSVTKDGAGSLVLTGSNSGGSDFTGTLTVSGGALVVNGSFGDATAHSAQIFVGAGGALGGSGTILGSVTSDGAIGAGNSPGTLTIAGDLTLGAASILNFELGEAGIVGGLNNDLVVVGGNLTLDGTLNVLPLPTFGNGYYRLFNYGGTLTDSGLDLGSIPTGYTATLLTNIGGQVNILLGGGVQAALFWDGGDFTGASATAGGSGSSGTWSTTGTNWTAPDGYAVNGAWGGQVAVFGGASGGEVSIEGTQSFQELRFITDGYNLSAASVADGLATTGGFSVIDVAGGIGATIEAAISGTGGLTKTGGGTLTLDGPNSYAGGTVISAGRLVGDAASLGGDIENSAELEFVQATNATYAGSFSGAGSFAKSGAGRLLLTGNSASFTGVTSVLGGELSVNGMLSNSVVMIGSGSILSGAGMVGGINASADSTVAPGNSIGTLAVGGNVSFAGGSTYLAEVAPTGADLIDATGTAQLAGTLALTNLGGNYRANATYVLVRADAGRAGTFDTTTGLDSFGSQYRPSIVYTDTEVQLLLGVNQLSLAFDGFAGTENQMSVIGGLDAAILGGHDPQALSALYELGSGPALGRALDQLSGAIYPTAVRAALDDGRLVREGAIFRMRDAQDAGLSGAGIWGQVVGSWASANSDGNGPAYDQDRKGVLTGIDFGNASEEGSWRAGVYAHHLDTDVAAASLASNADIERKGFGAYAGLELGRFTARLGVSYSDINLDASRAIGFTGFSDSARGKVDGDALQGFGEIGYRVISSEGTFLEPFMAASVESLELDEFAETGGAASLLVSKQENTFATATLGLRAVTELQLSDENLLRLAASAGGQRNFGDRRITSTVALNDVPDFDFPIAAVGLEPWVLAMSARAAVDIGDSFTAGIDYSGIIGGSTRDHGVRATVGFRF